MFRVRKQIGCKETFAQLKPKQISTIGVLDTGVWEHPDLAGKILDFRDFVGSEKSPYDDSGHGTHVCGIAGGTGKLSQGKYRGIAPQTNFVVGKVLDAQGNGSAAAMGDGICWMLEMQQKYSIGILSISIGIADLADKEKEKHLLLLLEQAYDAGILVVCAAGNGGPGWNSLSPLGKSKKVITVGCHDGEYFQNMPGRCESYSARGALLQTVHKPDIVAPGTEIISCDRRCRRRGKGYLYAYTKKSGTSMATPIVSGTLALFLQQNPECKVEVAKRKLLYSAKDLGEPWYKQGYGMVQVDRLLEETSYK